jgi:hypothetical protein
MRTAFGGVTAVIRLHPAASLLPAMITSVLMALFVLVSVQAVQLPLPGVSPGLASAPRDGDQALPGGPPAPASAAGVPGLGGQAALAQVTSSRGSPVRPGSGAASGGAAVSGTVSAAVLGTGVAATTGVNSGDTGS